MMNFTRKRNNFREKSEKFEKLVFSRNYPMVLPPFF